MSRPATATGARSTPRTGAPSRTLRAGSVLERSARPGAASVLEVRRLAVSFPQGSARRRVVAGLDYAIAPGRTLGVVGESGCGKSMTALALMGLVPAPGRVSGSVRFEGVELIGQPEARWRALRGDRIAMVFQEPMTSLNPVMPVGR